MKYLPLLLLLLAFACGKPTSQSESKADSLRLADSLAAANASEINPTPQTGESEVVEGDPEYKGEAGVDIFWSKFGGEYMLLNGSEAEDGSSLTMTYVNGSSFNISITKMVADFCSGTIDGEITFDSNNTATFEADGHPVKVKLVNGIVEVEDPERHLGVGTCEYNGTFVSITDGID